MDVSTSRKILDNGNFDPTGTPVNLAGSDLQRVFDEKLKNLPPLRAEDHEKDGDKVEYSEEDDRQRRIAVLENKKADIEFEIAKLRNPPPKERTMDEEKEKAPVAATSKPPEQPKAPAKRELNKRIADNTVLTFEQKKDLSEAIQKLDGPRLERVIQIIHEGVPEIRDSTEEIELEIDALPAQVLTRLYNYVIPLRHPIHPKRSRSGKGPGPSGLKRKFMDDEKEAEKIRQLEQRMALFEAGVPLEHSSDPGQIAVT